MFDVVRVELDGKNVARVVIPLVLPLITGEYIPEGSIHNVDTVAAISAVHPFVKCWIETG